MTENAVVTIQEAIDVEIGSIYNRFGFETSSVGERIHELLENPENRKPHWDEDSEPSEAAHTVRSILWSTYSGGGTSAIATCKLFIALGRKDELKWLLKEAHMDK